MKVSPLDALGNPIEDAEEVERFESQQDQMVFLFSPTCLYSIQALEDWALLRNLAKGHARIVALTTGIGLNNARLNDLFEGEARLAIDRDQIEANRMLITPQVLWISPEGRVKAVWVGSQAKSPQGKGFREWLKDD